MVKWWWKISYSYPSNLRSSGQNYCPLAAGENPSVAEGSNCIPHHRLFMMLFHCRRFHWTSFWPYPEFWLELFDYLLCPIHSSDEVSPFDPCSNTQQSFAATCPISARANHNQQRKSGKGQNTVFLAHKAQKVLNQEGVQETTLLSVYGSCGGSPHTH